MRQTKAAPRETPTAKLIPTAFDAAAVAASTALIIGMVGSLVFFLIVAFYRGQYDGRLMYIFGLYSAAIVLVARIAIESGRTYANAFSLPLAAVSILAIMRFVTITGPLGPLSWLVNIGLLAIAWFLADRITFDCTLISERERSLQQGLLQSLGLLKPDGLTRTPRDITREMTREIAEDLSLKQQAVGNKPNSSKKKRHNPGVWVLYFALLAFPLFGLGQLAIPDEQQRDWAFTFLFSYLACALSLLVLTSLVGMRRYLRQRGVAMPPEMNLQWLTVGLGSILVILVLCLVLPLPGRSLGLVGLPAIFQSPELLQTSQWGWGKEGSDNQSNSDATRSATEPADDQQAKKNPNPPADGPPAANGKGPPQASDQASHDASVQESEQGKSEQGKSGDKSDSKSNSKGKGESAKNDTQPADDSRGKQSKNSDPKNSDLKKQGSQQSDDGSTNDSTQTEQVNSPKTKEQSSGNDDAKKSPEPNRNAKGDQPAAEQPQQTEQNDQATDSSTDSNSQSTSANPLSQLLSQFSSLGELFKWLTIAVLAAIVIIYALTHPGEVAKFWRELCALIAALFGRRRSLELSPTEANVTPGPTLSRRPFHSYPNPFAAQLAGWTAAQVIEHTFAALEAWAAEHGTPRLEQQTAAEFARQLAVAQPSLAPHTLVAANMLDQLMFANWKPQIADLQPLAKLWHSLCQTDTPSNSFASR